VDTTRGFVDMTRCFVDIYAAISCIIELFKTRPTLEGADGEKVRQAKEGSILTSSEFYQPYSTKSPSISSDRLNDDSTSDIGYC
jgi:hypothetical protein